MRVYISCHHPDPANELAAALTAAGHEVVSTWHTTGEPRPADTDAKAWYLKAAMNFGEIESADTLVIIASLDHIARIRCVPGGKFVEAGYALAYGIRVYAIGGAGNGMMYAADVEHVQETSELLALLS